MSARGPMLPHEIDQERESRRKALEDLGLVDLSARWEQQPDLQFVSFGGGLPAHQTILGNPEDAFHGVAIYNSTGRFVFVGFNASAGVGSALKVAPGNILVWPAQYANIDLAVQAADAAGPVEAVGVLRLRYPPEIALKTATVPLEAAVAPGQPLDAKVLGVSVQLVAANASRRGLEIINNGAKAVRLALGIPAVAKHGLWLAPEGGTWDGKLSGALWLGEVNAITDSGEETTVAVVEA